MLLYLDGQGRQRVGSSDVRVDTGSVVMLPPGVSHAFFRARERSPVCLMINFQLRTARHKSPVVCLLSRSELAQVKQSLSAVSEGQTRREANVSLESALHLLDILKIGLRAAGWLARGESAERGAEESIAAQWMARVNTTQPLKLLVQQSGYQRDYLNRLVKQKTGLTLGQYRALRRLEESKRLLAEGRRVATVAAAVGLPDQNYFARWFRRQTGQPPSRWLGRRPSME